VRALGVNVKRVRAKRVGVVRSQHSDDTRRTEQIVAVSICERRFDRNPSSRQRRRNIGLAEAITCACRWKRGFGYCGVRERKTTRINEVEVNKCSGGVLVTIGYVPAFLISACCMREG
jgi:hypothetical protein